MTRNARKFSILQWHSENLLLRYSWPYGLHYCRRHWGLQSYAPPHHHPGTLSKQPASVCHFWSYCSLMHPLPISWKAQDNFLSKKRPPTLKHWERMKNWWLEMLGRAVWPSPKNVALVSRSEGEKKTQLTFKHWLTSFRLSILPNRSTELLPRLLAADCVDMYRALFTSRTCCWSSWSFGAVWSMFTRLRPQQQEANNRRVHLCVGLANNRANWINTKTQYPKTTEHFNYSKRYWSKV